MRRELAAQAAAEEPSSGGAGRPGGGTSTSHATGLAALGLELAPSGLSVRLAAEAAAAAPPGNLSEQMEAEVVAAGGAAGVVVIPADSRWGCWREGAVCGLYAACVCVCVCWRPGVYIPGAPKCCSLDCLIHAPIPCQPQTNPARPASPCLTTPHHVATPPQPAAA